MSIEELSNSIEDFKGEVITKHFLKCIIDAGTLALAVRDKGLSAEIKSSKEDFVTEGDLAVSSVLQSQLTQLYPGIGFLDEEVPVSEGFDITGLEIVAVIDPIDGTTNYYNNGEPGSLDSASSARWGVSVGILQKGEFIGGAIYQPAVQKLFYAEKGHGAFLNGQRLTVSSTETMFKAQLVYDFPYPKNKAEYERTERVIERLSSYTSSSKKLGSQVIEAMEVAEGASDLFFHLKTKPWDIAAATVIVTEAGGKVTNAYGDPFKISDESIILTNGKIDISPLLQIISEEVHG